MSQLEPWRTTGRRTLHETRIFNLVETTAISPRTGCEGTFTTLGTGDWVNIVALTPAQEIVLVRQWRHGIRDFALEIPGGLVDPGEDPATAAAREVREETGYAGDPVVELGVVEANPAILENRTYTYLLDNCRRVGEQQQDDNEDIEVVLVPLADIPQLVRDGTIRHALVICGFWWLALRRPDLLDLNGGKGR